MIRPEEALEYYLSKEPKTKRKALKLIKKQGWYYVVKQPPHAHWLVYRVYEWKGRRKLHDMYNNYVTKTK